MPERSSRTLAGVLLIVGAVLCFSCMDASAKWLGRVLNPWQTIAVRYVFSFALTGLFFNPLTRPGLMRTQHLGLQCGRALCVVVATASGWTALRFIELTQLTAITFAAPLLVALMAAPLLGEKIGPRRVVAVAVGFCGVLIVTRPFSGAIHPAGLLALVAAVANAIYSILTRRLAAFDAPETTMFYTGLVGSVVMLPVAPFVWETPTSALTWGVLAVLGSFGALAHWLLILAHRHAPASLLAPFYYAQILGAVVLGIAVFGEVPDRWTITGALIVTGSGLYLVYRERVRRKPVPSSDLQA
ncbi:DMT family transporter [Opitutus sp. ER46]|uniref:DMT family transporter n=1 Tax=Opitutus sp. ER46 TaxID=2161864 RepID=UPI001E494F51|nr:DMT family transporter [Opitutus sp. ER46]